VDETFVGGATQGEVRGLHHKTLVAGIVEVRPRKKLLVSIQTCLSVSDLNIAVGMDIVS